MTETTIRDLARLLGYPVKLSSKRHDTCAVVGCRQPTLSRRSEHEPIRRVCRFHTPGGVLDVIKEASKIRWSRSCRKTKGKKCKVELTSIHGASCCPHLSALSFPSSTCLSVDSHWLRPKCKVKLRRADRLSVFSETTTSCVCCGASKGGDQVALCFDCL